MNVPAYLVCVYSAFLLVASAAFGGTVVWLYRDKTDLQATNQTQATALATVVAAAPRIAAQVDALRQAQRASANVASEFATIRPALASLADCPLPSEYARLLLAQDRAINAAGSEIDRARLPKD